MGTRRSKRAVTLAPSFSTRIEYFTDMGNLLDRKCVGRISQALRLSALERPRATYHWVQAVANVRGRGSSVRPTLGVVSSSVSRINPPAESLRFCKSRTVGGIHWGFLAEACGSRIHHSTREGPNRRL